MDKAVWTIATNEIVYILVGLEQESLLTENAKEGPSNVKDKGLGSGLPLHKHSRRSGVMEQGHDPTNDQGISKHGAKPDSGAPGAPGALTFGAW